MARLHHALVLLVGVTLPVALGGCVEMVVVGGLAAAAGSGYVAGQERGIDGTATDFAITTDIAKAFTDADPQLQANVTTTVYGGRVLLTGRVPRPEMKAAAAQIAGRVPSVRTVHDEIEVASGDTFWDDAKDVWISTQLRSELIADTGVRSVNYMIDTENGSVYLMGSARSQRELDRVTDIARHVSGVKRVVSYVELRSGTPVATGPAAPPAAGYGAGPPAASAAPQTPIEVQKL